MSSIRGSHFDDNLRRIYSSLSGGEKGAHQSGLNGQKEFAEVLADLDRNAAKSSEIGALVPEKAAQETKILHPNEVLTNLDPLNEFIDQQPSKEARASLSPRAYTELMSPRIATLEVKNPTPRVKDPIPIPTLPIEKGHAPAAPQVVGAMFKDLPRNIQTVSHRPPKTPEVRSAEWLHETVYAGEFLKSKSYSETQLHGMVSAAGKHHGVDPHLAIAVAEAESNFRINAVSKDGHKSKGMFQLLDSTAKDMVNHLNFKSKYDAFDPGINAYLGTGYLRHLHDLFSEETKLTSTLKTQPAKSSQHLEKLALAAYNSGQGTVARAQERARLNGRDPSDYDAIKHYLPSSTRQYVSRVTQLRDEMTNLA